MGHNASASLLDAENIREIDLARCKLVSSGQVRFVYQHPDHDHLLIKVLQPERPRKKKKLHAAVKRRLFPWRTFGRYNSFAREVREMLRAAKQDSALDASTYPVARIHGFAATTSGLGLVVEKITSSDGNLAPTLRALLKEGRFTAHHHECARRFYEICAANHIILGDAHAGNLVFRDHEGGQVICIDGAGEKSILPVHEWSSFLNGRKLARWRDRLEAEIRRRCNQTAARPRSHPATD